MLKHPLFWVTFMGVITNFCCFWLLPFPFFVLLAAAHLVKLMILNKVLHQFEYRRMLNSPVENGFRG